MGHALRHYLSTIGAFFVTVTHPSSSGSLRCFFLFLSLSTHSSYAETPDVAAFSRRCWTGYLSWYSLVHFLSPASPMQHESRGDSPEQSDKARETPSSSLNTMKLKLKSYIIIIGGVAVEGVVLCRKIPLSVTLTYPIM